MAKSGQAIRHLRRPFQQADGHRLVVLLAGTLALTGVRAGVAAHGRERDAFPDNG